MITGSIVALVTPMHADGSLDWGSLERLLDMHIAAGTSAIGAVGTTGESATLSVPEHLEVIKYCVKYVAGRIPVIAGTGANSTREAIELTSSAARNGADACLLVTPYYNRPSQRGTDARRRARQCVSDREHRSPAAGGALWAGPGRRPAPGRADQRAALGAEPGALSGSQSHSGQMGHAATRLD